MSTIAEREELHRLLDRLSEEDLDAAERLLRGLLALRGNLSPTETPVGEPLSPYEEEAMREADEDIAAGRVISGEEIKRRFGLA